MNIQNIKLENQQKPQKSKKNLKRVLSSTNINFHQKLKNSIFPSLKNSTSILITRKKPLNNSAGKKNHYKIEIEKLYDQNVHYKRAIKSLQNDINEIKNELTKKQQLLNTMNKEIENIIKENRDETEFKMDPNLLNEQLNEQGRYTLIKKMKNRIKEAEKGLNKEILRNKNLKKDKKFTKFKELEIEKKIINEQNNKILSLIDNSLEMKSNHEKELYEKGMFNKNLESQKNIIYNLLQKFQELNDEEKNLENEIMKYEKILNKTNNRVKIVKLKQISLKDQNKKLIKEKEEFINKNKDDNNEQLLEDLRKKLSSAKNEYNYNKLKNQKTSEKLNNINKNMEQNIQQYKSIEGSLSIQKEDNNDNKNKIIKDNAIINENQENSEEYINKLKEIYQENKEKENELEKYLFLYQEAIQKKNNGENVNIEEIRNNILKLISKVDINNKRNNNNMNMDLVLSDSNPYNSNMEDNEPLSTGKFTNEQFGQFTYILFKNFEAKGIDLERAKSDIIAPLTEFYKNNKKSEDEKQIQEQLGAKFSEIILKLLNCNNENDSFRLKIYFSALYFDILINSEELNESTDKMELIVNYFLSLFNYIHIYTEKEKDEFKQKLKSKYNALLIKLKDLIKEYLSNKKDNKEYISLQEIKYILDNNNEIQIREKYFEFIIYLMKQFDDIKASLFDLKVENLENIIEEPLINDDTGKKEEINNNNIEKSKSNNSNNNDDNNINANVNENKNNIIKDPTESNESVEEVSPSVFNKNINDVLTIMKQIMENESKNLREIFVDSIVQITKPNADIITLESFANELNKRKISLNYLQLSCFNYKYCINNELHALDINKIEHDINNLKENVIQDYQESLEKHDVE